MLFEVDGESGGCGLKKRSLSSVYLAPGSRTNFVWFMVHGFSGRRTAGAGEWRKRRGSFSCSRLSLELFGKSRLESMCLLVAVRCRSHVFFHPFKSLPILSCSHALESDCQSHEANKP